MSIVIDDVILPDPPSEFLEVYPYVLIMNLRVDYVDELNNSGYEDANEWICLMSTYPHKVVTNNESTFMYCLESFISLLYDFSSNSWFVTEEIYVSDIYVEDISSVEIEGAGSMIYGIAWSNYDIMLCNPVDENTLIDIGVYKEGRGAIVPPEEYAVNRSFLVNLGLHARRLSGVQNPLEISEIMEKFVAIETEKLEDAEGMEF